MRDDDRLFERLVLEINQAGLSWLKILKKREAFLAAFDGFEIARVAAYGDEARSRLLADAGIIRNRLKVDAAIENARRIQALKASHGSFADWLDAHHPRPHAEWVKLFKAHFKFTGGEICREFLLSTGYLEGAPPAGVSGLCRDPEAGTALAACLQRIARPRSRSMEAGEVLLGLLLDRMPCQG